MESPEIKIIEAVLYEFYNYCMDEKDGELREYYISEFIEHKKNGK